MVDVEPAGDEIAVIGLAGRFPGAEDVAALWRNLCDGVDSVHDYTEAELRRLGIGPDLLEPGAVTGAPVTATADGLAAASDPGDRSPVTGVGEVVALARRWSSGGAVDWERVFAGGGQRRVPLPAHPFARRRYWIDPPGGGTVASGGEARP